jgi:16S rRNA (uracil1498-N3)-methyltransferase
MDWVVQKATELGVRGITPLFTERTEVKLAPDRAAKKLQHWRQVAVSACEQCGRNTLPSIHELANLADWIAATDADCKLVLHHRSEGPALTDAVPHGVALLIGPEGGLSEAEIEAAESAGYRSLALGPRVMRTETAPLAAIAILQARWGDMGA